MTSTTFPLKRPHELPQLPEEHRWLIEGLWAHQAVGVIGGEPKCCKSMLALHMAVAVAAGRKCIARYPVEHGGTALVFAAEDPLHTVRERLAGICAHQGLLLDQLDVWVITIPVMRIDHEEHRVLLEKTVAAVQPTLLVLDPFVRLHTVDENLSVAVAPLLGFLRELQRTHGCAVALVHHARKGGGAMRPGQALRGSSELHAWGDSNLYVRRDKEQLWLTAEHRGHPSLTGIPLSLDISDTTIALTAGEPQAYSPRVRDRTPVVADHDRVLDAFAGFDGPIRVRQLRAACRIRSDTLMRVLNELRQSGRVNQTEQGWMLS